MYLRPRKMVRAALHLIAVATLVVLTGVAIQATAEAGEQGRFPAPGHVVEIGDGQVSDRPRTDCPSLSRRLTELPVSVSVRVAGR